MATQIDPNRCQFSKYQPESRRMFVDADLADLESVKDKGLYYAIKVYEEPGRPGWYIVKDGWRRVNAWLRWRPGEPIPADVEDAPADDRSLFEQAVISNEGRENFNAIQKADLCAQYIALGATQAKAGALFNPPLAQAAVSHLLRLRSLPAEIKAHVESGALAERHARQLVTVAKHAPDKAIEAANIIAGEAEDKRDDVSYNVIWGAYCETFRQLAVWSEMYKWPAAEKAVPDAQSDKGEPATITACTDCKFKVEFNKIQFCTRPACYGLKERLRKALDDKAREKTRQTARSTNAGSSSFGPQDASSLAAAKATKREAEEAETKRILHAAIEAISLKLPGVPLAYEMFMLDIADQVSDWDTDDVPEWAVQYTNLHGSKLETLKPTERTRYTKALIIMNQTWNYNTTPTKLRKSIEKLCGKWKIKLPKGWDTAKVSAPKTSRLISPKPTTDKVKVGNKR